MATYSTVTISNKALVFCGASPITSLTDGSANARAMDAAYDIARKSIMTECRWTFSTTRSTLVTNSTTDLIPWFHTGEGEDQVYDMPTDPVVLRIWEMNDPNAIWRVEGLFIISDTVDLGVKYTWDHTDENQWRPKFVAAFIDKLASDVAFMILNDAKKAQLFLEKYQKISLPAAMTENSQTGTHQRVLDDAWTNSKYANRGGGDPSRSYS